MTAPESPPVSPAALRTRLIALLEQAEREGVSVAGGWTCRSDDGETDWDVVITELRSTDERK